MQHPVKVDMHKCEEQCQKMYIAQSKASLQQLVKTKVVNITKIKSQSQRALLSLTITHQEIYK